MNYVAYAAGFLLSPDMSRVALVRKKRPKWQAGLFNAVGGHVELGETALQTMRREFAEEAGLDVEDWRHDADLTGPDFSVAFFSARGSHDGLLSLTDEEVSSEAVVDVLAGRLPQMRNLRLLLALALDDSGLMLPVALLDSGARP